MSLGPLGYAHTYRSGCLGWIRTITWPASEAGGLPIAPPGKAVGEEGFEPSTARFQTAYADLTALLAEKWVAALATGTARAATRKREDSSSESKHDDGSPRTSSNPNLRLALEQHHLLSVGDGSVSRTHRELLMRQLL